MKKKILGTSNAWSMSRSSHQPSDPAYYIEDCWISVHRHRQWHYFEEDKSFQQQNRYRGVQKQTWIKYKKEVALAQQVYKALGNSFMFNRCQLWFEGPAELWVPGQVGEGVGG